MIRTMSYTLTRVATLIVVALCLTFGLSACGKKSALTPPEESRYPKQYPRQ